MGLFWIQLWSTLPKWCQPKCFHSLNYFDPLFWVLASNKLIILFQIYNVGFQQGIYKWNICFKKGLICKFSSYRREILFEKLNVGSFEICMRFSIYLYFANFVILDYCTNRLMWPPGSIWRFLMSVWAYWITCVFVYARPHSKLLHTHKIIL